MSLAGQRIVVTRAAHQADEFARCILEAGAIPVLYPCIDIVPPKNTTALDTVLQNLNTFDKIIFTSANTATAVSNRLQELDIISKIDWYSIRIATVGTKTYEAVQNIFDRDPDFVPSKYTASTLAQEVPVFDGEKVLLPLSARSDGELTDLLITRGASVTTVDAYENVIGTGGEDVPALLRENKIDALTFTSGSTVENFVKRIAPQTAFDLPAICIGPSTHEIAIEQGFARAIYPDNYSLRSMVSLLKEFFEEVPHGNT